LEGAWFDFAFRCWSHSFEQGALSWPREATSLGEFFWRKRKMKKGGRENTIFDEKIFFGQDFERHFFGFAIFAKFGFFFLFETNPEESKA